MYRDYGGPMPTQSEIQPVTLHALDFLRACVSLPLILHITKLSRFGNLIMLDTHTYTYMYVYINIFPI